MVAVEFTPIAIRRTPERAPQSREPNTPNHPTFGTASTNHPTFGTASTPGGTIANFG